MQLVIADTSPINYLLLINHIELLPALFHEIILPSVVRKEISHLKSPQAVRDWIADPPAWVEMRQTGPHTSNSTLDTLDAGEEDAIALALELHASLLLMDDADGVIVARAKGFEVMGTFGILQRAAERQLISLPEAFDRIKQTNFRYRQQTLNALLAEWQASQ